MLVTMIKYVWLLINVKCIWIHVDLSSYNNEMLLTLPSPILHQTFLFYVIVM